jgi:hypothetical protein
LSYLRFTPDEYQTMADLCRWQRLGRLHQPAFRRHLADALKDINPDLAKRIARLGRAKLSVLYWHFRERTLVVKSPTQFTTQDLQLVAEACVTAPFPVRLVRPFKTVLVELFQDDWPGLARKLARLSGHQFEQLYEQVVCERRQD